MDAQIDALKAVQARFATHVKDGDAIAAALSNCRLDAF